MTCLFRSNLCPKQQLFSDFGLIVLKKVKNKQTKKSSKSVVPYRAILYERSNFSTVNTVIPQVCSKQLCEHVIPQVCSKQLCEF